MNHDRLEQQIAFLKEIDKLKHVLRQTRLLDDSRYENAAEHAWHLGVMAVVLIEHADAADIDLARVIRMLLIHDIVEIDAGDTVVYDTAARQAQKEPEEQAAARLFGLLPSDQRNEMLALWQEFEARQTPEARFAAALDRLEPCLQNAATNGHAWHKHGVSRARAEAHNAHMGEGSQRLWQYTQQLFADAEAGGCFSAEPDEATSVKDSPT